MSMQLKLQTAGVTLVTVNLSAKILKQLPRLSYDEVSPLFGELTRKRKRVKEIEAKYSTEEGATDEERREAEWLLADTSPFIGWLHGSLFAKEESDHGPRLLIRKENGAVALYCTMSPTVKEIGCPQLFLA